MRFVKTMDSLHPVDEEAATFLIHAPDGAELEFKAITKQRTGRQNRALHSWLSEVASTLNAAGFDMRKFPWKEGVEIPWDLELAKEWLWRPIQIAILDKTSTTDLTTAEVDKVYQPLARKLAQMGVQVPPLGRD